jgi:putative SOS response-associated peptidase YedK
MPVILEASDFEQWENGDEEDAAALMKPAAEDILRRWPISRRVNSSKAPADDPSLIDIARNVAEPNELAAARTFAFGS